MDHPYEPRSFRDTMRKFLGSTATPHASCSETDPIPRRPSPLTLRVLAPKADLIDCAAIERVCQVEDVPTVTLVDLTDSFKPEADMGPTHGYVADWDEYPVGYLTVRQWRHSLLAMGFAVDPRYRRRGVGATLLMRFLATLNPANRWAMAFRVHERQVACQVFLRSYGFLMTRIYKHAYPDGQAQYFFTYCCDRERIGA
jgi:GNAT superfamily N-acetyltransferase